LWLPPAGCALISRWRISASASSAPSSVDNNTGALIAGIEAKTRTVREADMAFREACAEWDQAHDNQQCPNPPVRLFRYADDRGISPVPVTREKLFELLNLSVEQPVFFVNRPPLPGEEQEVHRHFRSTEHLQHLVSRQSIVAARNASVTHGIAINSFNDEFIDTVTGAKRSVPVVGLDEISRRPKITIFDFVNEDSFSISDLQTDSFKILFCDGNSNTRWPATLKFLRKFDPVIRELPTSSSTEDFPFLDRLPSMIGFDLKGSLALTL
jgi:hypothetical protein